MVFDAAVVGELRALCAGRDGSADALEFGDEPLGSLTAEQLRHHLLRSLEPAPADEVEARRLLGELAAEVGVTPATLRWALARRDGEPRRTWRLAVGPRSTQRLRWLLMREGGFIAVGRDEAGDLSTLTATAEGRAALRARLIEAGSAPARATRLATQLTAFAQSMRPGDLVVAADGDRALGVGVVTGPYGHVNDRALAHRRPVAWLTFDEVPLPDVEPREPLVEVSGHDAAMVAIEAALLRARLLPASAGPASAPPSEPQVVPLPAPVAAVDEALRRKGQVILAGPPGTGKSFWAERSALELAARSWFGAPYERLGEEARRQLVDAGAGGLGAVEVCCFHPSFGYEDFIEGLRPQVAGGQLAFERRDGLFKRLCRRALLNPGRAFFLVIDEFNRGDVPRILGDLLAVLDADRRGQAVTLPLSAERLVVPPNVHLVATMNAADRSTAPLDAALRRRFAVLDLPPDASVLAGARAGQIDLGRLLEGLNARLVQLDPRPGLDLRVGHALLMVRGRPVEGLGALAVALRQDILPTLWEQLLGDAAALGALLGPAMVDRERGGLAEGLFRPGHEAALEAALLEAFPAARVRE